MNILLSNDDGVYAPGIHSLYNALSSIANVTVVAPEVDRSASGKALTLKAPLSPRTLDNGFIAINGTPTDCVHLAITELLPTKPDLVVAGINAGANLGDDVLYSGTVAAATEGYCFDLPAMAFSLTGELNTVNFDKAGQFAKRLVEHYTKKPLLTKDAVLNINFPCCDTFPNPEKVTVTRLGQRHKAEGMVKLKDPKGRTVYWLGPPGKEQDAGEGTDFYALSSGEISITPLQMDLTHHAALNKVTEWAQEL